jgi:hypothetical protein
MKKIYIEPETILMDFFGDGPQMETVSSLNVNDKTEDEENDEEVDDFDDLLSRPRTGLWEDAKTEMW